MKRTVVVGAAVVRDGRILVGRRRSPPELAGRWEFPGGKVEAGESEPEALRRELREELSVKVRVGRVIGRTGMSDTAELAVYSCELLDGEPRAGTDHDQLRWLTASQLWTVDWLDADRALLDDVVGALTPRSP